MSAGAVRGSCLCGAVSFEVTRFEGPFELCHCPRCRKVTGSSFVAGVRVLASEFRWLGGQAEIEVFELPVRDRPPPYRTAFCRHCGSPTPPPPPLPEDFEIHAGLFDDPGVPSPDRHIFVEHLPEWDEIADDLPQLDVPALAKLRGLVKD